MTAINQKNSFNYMSNIFLLLFFFYYYFPQEIGMILYSFLLYSLLVQINIRLKPIDFTLIIVSAALCFYYVFSNQAPIFDIFNIIRFSAGILFFVLYFNNKESFDGTKLLYLLIISIYVEALLINSVISIYDMPNFPAEEQGANSHFTSVVAKTWEEGGRFGQERIGLDLPIGFGGIRSVTSNILVLVLFLSKRSLINELIVLATILFLGTGTGLLSFLIYLVFKKRYIYLNLIYLLPIILLIDNSLINKISYEYISILFVEKNEAILGSYVDKTIYDFFIGVGKSDGSSDFAWLLILRSMGFIFFIIFLIWFTSKFNSRNVGALLVAFILTIHYPVIFSVPGQLVIGYIISRRFKENYLL